MDQVHAPVGIKSSPLKCTRYKEKLIFCGYHRISIALVGIGGVNSMERYHFSDWRTDNHEKQSIGTIRNEFRRYSSTS